MDDQQEFVMRILADEILRSAEIIESAKGSRNMDRVKAADRIVREIVASARGKIIGGED